MPAHRATPGTTGPPTPQRAPRRGPVAHRASQPDFHARIVRAGDWATDAAHWALTIAALLFTVAMAVSALTGTTHLFINLIGAVL